MIPLSKNSLSRIDLSTVLENMVENNISGKQLGQDFATKLAIMLGGISGISVGNIPDSFSCIVDLLDKNDTSNKNIHAKSNTVEHTAMSPRALFLLPVTIPHVLAASLQRMNFALFFYDIAEDAITPNIEEEVVNTLLEQYKDLPQCLVLFYPFGVSNHFPLVLPPICNTMSKIVLSYTIPSAKKEASTDSDTSTKEPSPVLPKTDEVATNPMNFYTSNSDFSVLIMEQNNVITSATGAVVSIHHKKYKGALKELEDSYYLLSDFNAALAHSQLKQLERFNQKCIAIKDHYKASAYKNALSLPEIVVDTDVIMSSFPIILKGGTKNSIQFFRKQGIECALFFENSYLHYGITKLAHLKEAYITRYPNAIELLHHMIHVPLYASLTNDEVGHISKAIASVL